MIDCTQRKSTGSEFNTVLAVWLYAAEEHWLWIQHSLSTMTKTNNTKSCRVSASVIFMPEMNVLSDSTQASFYLYSSRVNANSFIMQETQKLALYEGCQQAAWTARMCKEYSPQQYFIIVKRLAR